MPSVVKQDEKSKFNTVKVVQGGRIFDIRGRFSEMSPQVSKSESVEFRRWEIVQEIGEIDRSGLVFD